MNRAAPNVESQQFRNITTSHHLDEVRRLVNLGFRVIPIARRAWYPLAGNDWLRGRIATRGKEVTMTSPRQRWHRRGDR